MYYNDCFLLLWLSIAVETVNVKQILFLLIPVLAVCHYSITRAIVLWKSLCFYASTANFKGLQMHYVFDWSVHLSVCACPSPTCRTTFPAQHLRPSGVLSCWPDGLELTAGFYPGSNEQHRLFKAST